MEFDPCPSLENCQFFNCLNLSGVANVLKNLYCKLRYKKCARYQRKQNGELVPEKLWPNGQIVGEK
ncbi:hypothetical protein K8R78_08830 [bacterium]|nr:hypothetical protein [bacterium]